MGSKLFFTLGYVIPFHFIERIADERTMGLELPVTLGATEALKILVLNPFQCALHGCSITPAVSKTVQPLSSTAFQFQAMRRLPMTEERKHAILLATVILTVRKLQSLLKADDEAGKPNLGTAFWAEVFTKKSIERAAHILDLIDAKWPG